MTKKLTGAQIRNMLETSLTIQKNCIAANDSGEWDAWPNDSGSYLQIGGITVSFDPAQPEGSRVLSVKKDGQELDNTKEYIVAVNNYLAGSALLCWMLLLLFSGSVGSICLVQKNKK